MSDPNKTPDQNQSSQPTPQQSSAWLWIITMVYGLHVMEEHAFNWAAWANTVGLAYTWTDFYITNSEVILFGACAAAIGWRMPTMSLAFPALALVNGLIFHALPTLIQRRPNPGALTALLLFLPIGFYIFRTVLKQRLASRREIFGAFTIAIGAQLFPLILLKLQPLLSY